MSQFSKGVYFVSIRSNAHPPAGAAILAILLLLAGMLIYFIPA